MGSEAPVERGLGELPGDIGYQCRDQDVEQRMGEHAGAGRANQPKRVKPPKGRQEDKGDRDQNNAEGAPDHADRAWPRRRGRVVSAQHLAEAAAECPVDHRRATARSTLATADQMPDGLRVTMLAAHRAQMITR